MSKIRILYVTSEINPFLEITNEVAEFVRKLPQAMQEKGLEIRILMPRFGCINERKNRLHEVVRLSGINISVGDEEKPLVIKVASIPTAKLQVYFIDNEDYFKRKSIFTDKDDNFFPDNDERSIFFCKGVLETVKKLGWAPNIVHCNDWMTALIPLFLKTSYKEEPIFKNVKSIFSVYYAQGFEHQFETDLAEKIIGENIDAKQLEDLKNGGYNSFVKIGSKYADLVINAETKEKKTVDGLIAGCGKSICINDIEASEEILDKYYELYTELA